MPEIEKRLNELRYKNDENSLDQYERVALYRLYTAGIENFATVIHYTGKDKYVVWAAETIVWTCRRLRAKENREALRGWGQLREYCGQNGGSLPASLSEACVGIQNELEKRIA